MQNIKKSKKITPRVWIAFSRIQATKKIKFNLNDYKGVKIHMNYKQYKQSISLYLDFQSDWVS